MVPDFRDKNANQLQSYYQRNKKTLDGDKVVEDPSDGSTSRDESKGAGIDEATAKPGADEGMGHQESSVSAGGSSTDSNARADQVPVSGPPAPIEMNDNQHVSGADSVTLAAPPTAHSIQINSEIELNTEAIATKEVEAQVKGVPLPSSATSPPNKIMDGSVGTHDSGGTSGTSAGAVSQIHAQELLSRTDRVYNFSADVLKRSRKDPFHKVTTIIKLPQKLQASGNPRSPPSQQSLRLEVNISALQHSEIAQSGAEPRVQNGNLQLLLRAYRNNSAPGASAKATEDGHQWPLETIARINGTNVGVKQRKVSRPGGIKTVKGDCEPIDIFPWCRIGSNDIEIECSDMDEYAFLVQVVQIVSVEQLMSDYQSQARMSDEEALERVKASFPDGDGVAAMSTKLSLRCPLGLCLITVPARGLQCTHLQCFDLPTYLRCNRKNSGFGWKCSVCNNAIDPTEMVVDTFMWNILQSEQLEAAGEIDEIEIHGDGRWEPIAVEGAGEGGDSGAEEQAPPFAIHPTAPPAALYPAPYAAQPTYTYSRPSSTWFLGGRR